jgi:hypothetical protein
MKNRSLKKNYQNFTLKTAGHIIDFLYLSGQLNFFCKIWRQNEKIKIYSTPLEVKCIMLKYYKRHVHIITSFGASICLICVKVKIYQSDSYNSCRFKCANITEMLK